MFINLFGPKLAPAHDDGIPASSGGRTSAGDGSSSGSSNYKISSPAPTSTATPTTIWTAEAKKEQEALQAFMAAHVRYHSGNRVMAHADLRADDRFLEVIFESPVDAENDPVDLAMDKFFSDPPAHFVLPDARWSQMEIRSSLIRGEFDMHRMEGVDQFMDRIAEASRYSVLFGLKTGEKAHDFLIGKLDYVASHQGQTRFSFMLDLTGMSVEAKLATGLLMAKTFCGHEAGFPIEYTEEAVPLVEEEPEDNPDEVTPDLIGLFAENQRQMEEGTLGLTDQQKELLQQEDGAENKSPEKEKSKTKKRKSNLEGKPKIKLKWAEKAALGVRIFFAPAEFKPLLNRALELEVGAKPTWMDILSLSGGSPQNVRFLVQTYYGEDNIRSAEPEEIPHAILRLAKPAVAPRLTFQKANELEAVSGVPMADWVRAYLPEGSVRDAAVHDLEQGFTDETPVEELSQAGISFFRGHDLFYLVTQGLSDEAVLQQWDQRVKSKFPLFSKPSAAAIFAFKELLQGHDLSASDKEALTPETLISLFLCLGASLTQKEMRLLWIRAFSGKLTALPEIAEGRLVLPGNLTVAGLHRMGVMQRIAEGPQRTHRGNAQAQKISALFDNPWTLTLVPEIVDANDYDLPMFVGLSRDPFKTFTLKVSQLYAFFQRPAGMDESTWVSRHYFLGTQGDGQINYSLPEGKTWEEIQAMDVKKILTDIAEDFRPEEDSVDADGDWDPLDFWLEQDKDLDASDWDDFIGQLDDRMLLKVMARAREAGVDFSSRELYMRLHASELAETVKSPPVAIVSQAKPDRVKTSKAAKPQKISWEELKAKAAGQSTELRRLFAEYFPGKVYETEIPLLARPSLHAHPYYRELKALSGITGISIEAFVHAYWNEIQSADAVLEELSQGTTDQNAISHFYQSRNVSEKNRAPLVLFFQGHRAIIRLSGGLSAQAMEEMYQKSDVFERFPGMEVPTLAVIKAIDTISNPDTTQNLDVIRITPEGLIPLLLALPQPLDHAAVAELWMKAFPRDRGLFNLDAEGRLILPKGVTLEKIWRHSLSLRMMEFFQTGEYSVAQLISDWEISTSQYYNFLATPVFGSDEKAAHLIRKLWPNDLEAQNMAMLCRHPWFLWVFPEVVDASGKRFRVMGSPDSIHLHAQNLPSARRMVILSLLKYQKERGVQGELNPANLSSLGLNDGLVRQILLARNPYNADELLELAQKIEGIDRVRLVEGGKIGELTYFMGLNQDGGVNWNLPPGWTAEKIEKLDVFQLMMDIAAKLKKPDQSVIAFWHQFKGLEAGSTNRLKKTASSLNTQQISIVMRQAAIAGLPPSLEKALYLHFHWEFLSHFHPFWAKSYELEGLKFIPRQKMARARSCFEKARDLYLRAGLKAKAQEMEAQINRTRPPQTFSELRARAVMPDAEGLRKVFKQYFKSDYTKTILRLARPELSKVLYYRELMELGLSTGIEFRTILDFYQSEIPEYPTILEALAEGFDDQTHHTRVRRFRNGEDSKRRALMAFFQGHQIYFRMTAGESLERAHLGWVEQGLDKLFPLLPSPTIAFSRNLQNVIKNPEEYSHEGASGFTRQQFAAFLIQNVGNLNPQEFEQAWLAAFPQEANLFPDLKKHPPVWVLPRGTTLQKLRQASIPFRLVGDYLEHAEIYENYLKLFDKTLLANYCGSVLFGRNAKTLEIVQKLWPNDQPSQNLALLSKFPWILVAIPNAVDEDGGSINLFGELSPDVASARREIARQIYEGWSVHTHGRILLREEVAVLKTQATETGQQEKSNEQFLADLGLQPPTIKRMLDESEVPSDDQLDEIARHMPRLDRTRLLEGFREGYLQYYLGVSALGGVDWSLPDGWSLEAIRDLDVYDLFLKLGEKLKGKITLLDFWGSVSTFEINSYANLRAYAQNMSNNQIRQLAKVAQSTSLEGYPPLTLKVFYLHFQWQNLTRFYPIGATEELAQARTALAQENATEAKKHFVSAYQAFKIAHQDEKALHVLKELRPALCKGIHYREMKEMAAALQISLPEFLELYADQIPEFDSLISWVKAGVVNDQSTYAELRSAAHANEGPLLNAAVAFFWGHDLFYRMSRGKPLKETAQLLAEIFSSPDWSFPRLPQSDYPWLDTMRDQLRDGELGRGVNLDKLPAFLLAMQDQLYPHEWLGIWRQLLHPTLPHPKELDADHPQWVLPRGTTLADIWRTSLAERLMEVAYTEYTGFDPLLKPLGITKQQLGNFSGSNAFGTDEKARTLAEKLWEDQPALQTRALLSRSPWLLLAIPEAVDEDGKPLYLFGPPSASGYDRREIASKIYEHWSALKSSRNSLVAYVAEAKAKGSVEEQAMEDADFAAQRWGLKPDTARRMLDEHFVLNAEEIAEVAKKMPDFNRLDLWEGSWAGRLQFFLGMTPQGGVDFSLPPGWDLARIRGLDFESLLQGVAKKLGEGKTAINYWKTIPLFTEVTNPPQREKYKTALSDRQILVLAAKCREAGFPWITPKVLYLHYHAHELFPEESVAGTVQLGTVLLMAPAGQLLQGGQTMVNSGAMLQVTEQVKQVSAAGLPEDPPVDRFQQMQIRLNLLIEEALGCTHAAGPAEVQAAQNALRQRLEYLLQKNVAANERRELIRAIMEGRISTAMDLLNSESSILFYAPWAVVIAPHMHGRPLVPGISTFPNGAIPPKPTILPTVLH